MRFAMFQDAEYVALIAFSAIRSFSSRQLRRAVPARPIWMPLKMSIFILSAMWVRATLPRVRYDALMSIGWKVLLPARHPQPAGHIGHRGLARRGDRRHACHRLRQGIRRHVPAPVPEACYLARPRVQAAGAPRFRGRHRLHRHENGLEKCVGCSLCAAACPADCIRVVAAGIEEERYSSAAAACRTPSPWRR